MTFSRFTDYFDELEYWKADVRELEKFFLETSLPKMPFWLESTKPRILPVLYIDNIGEFLDLHFYWVKEYPTNPVAEPYMDRLKALRNRLLALKKLLEKK